MKINIESDDNSEINQDVRLKDDCETFGHQ